MKKHLLLLLLLTYTLTIFAQKNIHPCATPEAKSDWLVEYQKAPERYFKNGNETIYVPLTIHIVGTDQGTGYYNIFNIYNAICELNEDFKASDIQFFVEGEFHYLNETDYYNHPDFSTGRQMMNENNVENTMNVYVVENPAGACGYAYLDGYGMALRKSCIGNGDNTFAHEMGHALSLPHVFLGWEGAENPDYSNPAPTNLENGFSVEKVDGSNCETAGDGFCDTPPDYLNYRWNCNEDGLSTRFQLDPDSVRFVSDGTLFMSYSLDECSYRFSAEQTGAMRANLLDIQSHLLYNQEPVEGIEATELEVITPILDDTVAVDQVVLDWEDVPGATHYFVQIGRTANFSVVVEKGIVTDSEFISDGELRADKKHYWRVTPYNSHDFCSAPLRGTNFRTMESTTSVADFNEEFSIQISPTLLRTTNEITIDIQSPSKENMTASLYNIAGQQLHTQSLQVIIGRNINQINVANLVSGVYFLKLNTATNQRTIKLIKQ